VTGRSGSHIAAVLCELSQAGGEHAEEPVEFLSAGFREKESPLFGEYLLDGPGVLVVDRGEDTADGGEGLRASQSRDSGSAP